MPPYKYQLISVPTKITKRDIKLLFREVIKNFSKKKKSRKCSQNALSIL